MSNKSLLKIFCSQSKVVLDKNAIRIHIKVINQAGCRIVPNYIGFNPIENQDQINVLKCIVCLYICVFPIVFLCGHVI